VANPLPEKLASDRFLQILQTASLITATTAQEQRHSRIHLTEAEQTFVRSRLGKLGRPRIRLYADASMKIKRWSPQNFVKLGKLLRLRYGAKFVIPEGADREQVEAIRRLNSLAPWFPP